MLKKLFVLLFVLLALVSFAHAKETVASEGQLIVIDGAALKDFGVAIKDGRIEIDVPAVAPIVGAVTAGDILGGLIVAKILSFIGFLVLAILVVAFFNKNVDLVVAATEKAAGSKFLWGLLVVLLIVPITVLLIVSVVGIVVLPVWIIILIAASILGYVAIAEIFGEKILTALKVKKPTTMTCVVVGTIILGLLGLVPFVGWLIKLVAAVCGLGAVLTTRFGTIKS